MPKWLRDRLDDGDFLSLSLDETPGLADALWKAVQTLLRTRAQSAERGTPRLSAAQRKRLEAVQKAAEGLVIACGPDVGATQRLIGNWADGGLLRGQNLAQLVYAVALLSHEASLRLSEGQQQPPHRAPDDAFYRFCLDVILALRAASEDITTYRAGSTARVLRLLLTTANERVPKDMFRHLKAALSAAPAAEKHRRAARERWADVLPTKRTHSVR